MAVRHRSQYSPFTALYRPLARSQNTHRSPACNWRGSPDPERIVPSKLNSSPPYAGSLKLSVFVRLNTSKISSACPWRPALMGRDSRTSQEKYALSLRSVLRFSTEPLAQIRSCGLPARCPLPTLAAPHFSDTGCAE